MAISDRAEALLKKVQASRKRRSERDEAIRDRVIASHRRAKTVIEESVERWEQRKEEAHAFVRELRGLHSPESVKAAKQPEKAQVRHVPETHAKRASDIAHRPSAQHPVEAQAPKSPEPPKAGRKTARQKGSGKQ